MPDIINILDESVTNVIAAGEVVENPASMIKELIENSLDAESKNIKLFINNSGRNVKILDDGRGMSKNDVFLSIERHATSKIKEKNDIFNITTFGFRGEALASIASVSSMKISSCNNNRNEGSRVLIKGGKIYKSENYAKNRGTEIEIKNLFFNTPARLKFLKTKNTEYGKIKDIVLKEALANFDVAFSLYMDDKNIISTSGNGIENCIIELFGKNVYKNLIPFKYGYLGKIDILKSSKNYIFTYFNKRYAKSKIIEKAIVDAYYTKLTKGKYPFVILLFEISPKDIDVNIHPSKKIVKFSNEKEVYLEIHNEIKIKFNIDEKKTVPEISFQDENLDIHKSQSVLFETEQFNGNHDEHITKDNSNFNVSLDYKKLNNIENTEKDLINKKSEVSDALKFHVIGQLFDTYIIVEENNSLEIYDQHIVHERILYEEFKEKYFAKKLHKKPLLIPERIELDIGEQDLIQNNIEVLNEFGIEIEKFGDREYLVRKIPDFEMRENIKDFIFDIIHRLDDEHFVKDLRENLIIEISCKGAIKKGEKLEILEMTKLIRKLKSINRYTCPHGRPIILKLSLLELEKKFKRK